MSKVPVVFLRTPYNYDTMAASNESALECLDESLAIQSAKDESDINTIVFGGFCSPRCCFLCYQFLEPDCV